MSFYTNFFSANQAVRNRASSTVTPKDQVETLIGNTGIYQDMGDYHVTTLYPSRGEIGSILNSGEFNAWANGTGLARGSSSPAAERGLARAASILSTVPTHGLQGAAYGAESRAYHIITKKDGNVGAALHATSVATLHTLMFPEKQFTMKMEVRQL